jgi:type II secretory ATPase GspE/PulE/Tfp pilus assembly ATPase PilB-like protein
MSITPAMAQLIATSTLATTATSIEQAAIKDGMVTILQDGIIKALNQVTTLEEVFTQVG